MGGRCIAQHFALSNLVSVFQVGAPGKFALGSVAEGQGHCQLVRLAGEACMSNDLLLCSATYAVQHPEQYTQNLTSVRKRNTPHLVGQVSAMSCNALATTASQTCTQHTEGTELSGEQSLSFGVRGMVSHTHCMQRAGLFNLMGVSLSHMTTVAKVSSFAIALQSKQQ
eukprot:4214401-Amphidinium_carterae.1